MVDDSWQGARDNDGNIFPNKRFPDMKGLADALHAKGLKLGLLTSPNDQTCAGFVGSAGHEDQDAATYASWGVDYLKDDWCGTGPHSQQTPEVIKPAYAKMRSALDKVGRDIVLNCTTYGFADPWNWASAAPVGANSWTVSTQMLDTFPLLSSGITGLVTRAPAASPGHWNDGGWLMLGKIGSDDPHFTHLTAAEQQSQLTMWSMAAAPLVLSCDLTQLDPNQFFPVTSSLLTNAEVFDIDQDALGVPARQIGGGGDQHIWSRTLSDGTRAVALYNSGGAQNFGVQWTQLGLSGPQPVRDLWRHVDLGPLENGYSTTVPAHGVVLLKVGQAAAPAA